MKALKSRSEHNTLLSTLGDCPPRIVSHQATQWSKAGRPFPWNAGEQQHCEGQAAGRERARRARLRVGPHAGGKENSVVVVKDGRAGKQRGLAAELTPQDNLRWTSRQQKQHNAQILKPRGCCKEDPMPRTRIRRTAVEMRRHLRATSKRYGGSSYVRTHLLLYSIYLASSQHEKKAGTSRRANSLKRRNQDGSAAWCTISICFAARSVLGRSAAMWVTCEHLGYCSPRFFSESAFFFFFCG